MKTILAKLDSLLGLVVKLLGGAFVTCVLSIWLLVIVALLANLYKLIK